MAEFCLDCWNKMNITNYDKKYYIISKDLDLCEGCGKWKPVIIIERKAYYMHNFRYFILPLSVINFVLYFIWRILLLPYLVFKYFKSKNKYNEIPKRPL